jgi:predicted dehydrogenase
MRTVDTNKSCCDRRRFLATTAGAGALVAGQWLHPYVIAGEQPKERIKIGQIGTGHEHASGKMDTLRKLSEHYEVVGIVEADPERRKKCENTPVYRGVKWMTEEELFSTKGLKAVAVETAVPEVTATAARCISAGMHIHLDKPGSEAIGPFKKMLDEAGRRGLAVQLGYMYRNNPAIQFCQRAVREGWLGHVFEIDAVMSIFHSVSYRKYLAQYRGGSMFIFGCHLIDLAVSMLGKPERVTPYLRQIRDDVKVYDNGLAVLEYPRTTVTIRTASLEVDGYQRRQLVVCGDEGTIDIRPLETYSASSKEPVKMRLALDRPRDSYKKGYQEIPFPLTSARYDEHLLEFARIVRGEIANPYPLSHELLVQEVLLAACGCPAE